MVLSRRPPPCKDADIREAIQASLAEVFIVIFCKRDDLHTFSNASFGQLALSGPKQGLSVDIIFMNM